MNKTVSGLMLTMTALALSLAPLFAADSKSTRPNFIVILIDDMGNGDIGPFGSKLNRTPHLDRMAAEGMKLTSFYSAPLCTASRTQLMTGCYARRVSMPDVLFPDNGTGLGPEEKTIAELLKPQGYATMCIGKWHLGDQPEFLPTRRGFDHYVGLPYSNNMDGIGGKEDKKGRVTPPLPLLRDDKVVEAPTSQTKLTKLYTEEAVTFITKNKEKPFFLYLPHTAVHGPINPGPEFSGKSKNGSYGDWVEEVDWSVGVILDTLKTLKLSENTLVIFTSDNGGSGKNASNAPYRGKKGSTWEGGLRVSTIAWWPEKIKAASTCDAMLSEMDILPTVVKLAGGKVPSERKIDGLDMWPQLSGQSKESPHEALFYFRWGTLEAVRSGPWKLAIAAQKDGEEKASEKESPEADKKEMRLYNLDSDIGEATNVADKNPEVVKRLQELIAKIDSDIGGLDKNSNKKKVYPGVRESGKVADPKPLIMSE